MPLRILAALSSALVVTSATSAQQATTSATAPARPTLVVLLTVDQLGPEYFERFGNQFDGGLARLYRHGAVYLNGWQDHAVTETAPGHASTLSGRFPRSTGIVDNLSNGVLDIQAPVIGGGSLPASPFRFRGTTLTDWMRSADPRTRALSVSRKDRGAILPLGRAKQHVFWYATTGDFSTSTYYADTLPTWVTRFNERRLAQGMHGRRWELSRPASFYPEPDSVRAENSGQDFLFPHTVPDSVIAAARMFPEYPWMDDLTLSFALAGVRALGIGAGPGSDVLAVSLSATDAIGHRYGPDSREAHDQVLRLDRALGGFLDTLFTLRDSSRIVIVLTADHGVTPLPDVRRPGRPADARRVVLAQPLAEARRAVVARGVDTLAVRFEAGMLLLDRQALGRRGVDADSLARAFARLARATPGVLRADEVRHLARADTVNDRIARRWLHTLTPDSPAAIVVTLKPYNAWGPLLVAMHGAPNDSDARVPIIFYGAPFRAGRQQGHARVVDIAPTLARVLGVTPTERLDGRPLLAVLRP